MSYSQQSSLALGPTTATSISVIQLCHHVTIPKLCERIAMP